MIKTLFLGTPVFSKNCLEALLLDKDYEVLAVVTQPDSPQGRKMKLKASPVKTLSLEKNLPVFTPSNINDLKFIKKIEELKAELCIVVAYGQILSLEFLKLFETKIVNLHGSLLPHLRGASPIQRALMEGCKITGVTLQQVVKNLDAGPVIAQKKINLKDENAKEVFEILEKKSIELLQHELKQYFKGEIQSYPQNEASATYAPKIKKQEARLCFSENALSLHNKIRALALGPKAFCFLDKEETENLKIIKSKPLETEISSSFKQAEIIEVTKDSFTVLCGNKTALKILQVQRASKKEMSTGEFLKGYSIKKKSFLY